MTDVLSDAANDAVISSSGNVFADLNLPSSPEDMLKIEISRAIAATLRRHNMTQADAAKLVGTDQAKISDLLRGRLKGFTTDRMIRYLVALGWDVDIRLSGGCSDVPGKVPGRVKVSQAA